MLASSLIARITVKSHNYPQKIPVKIVSFVAEWPIAQESERVWIRINIQLNLCRWQQPFKQPLPENFFL